MAYPSKYLVDALMQAADNLECGSRYMWSHMGHCNCGHLAQVLTGLSAEEIHKSAMKREGDWSEQSEHYEPYCPTTGFQLDYVIDSLIEASLHPTDIRELEYLSNTQVLKRLPGGFRYLQRNQSDHVVLYLRTWAQMLQDKLNIQSSAPTRKIAEVVA